MTNLWTQVLREYERLVFIPMTSGLSGTCATAQALSLDFDGKVTVVDNCAISATLKASVLEAGGWLTGELIQRRSNACWRLTPTMSAFI